MKVLLGFSAGTRDFDFCSESLESLEALALAGADLVFMS